MFFLIQVVPELWDPALPLSALYRLANSIRSVVTSGFPSNPVQVNFQLQMENNLQFKERLVIHFRNDHAHTHRLDHNMR